jgi:flagellin
VDFTNIKVSSTDLALTTDVKSSANAQTAIGEIDTALQDVSEFRATLGAKANRFATAVNTINNAVESLSAANSRVRDADVAEESARLARAQVLQQAAVSVTAQANQQPQLALKLLG